MQRFIRFIVIASIAGYLLVGCVGGSGQVRPTARATSSRSAVPITAAQRSDFDKALAYMKKQQYEKALPLLQQINRENNRLPGANINLAITYMQLVDEDDEKGYYEKAEQALLRAIEIKPKHDVAQFQLGLLYRKTGRFEQSRRAYELALKANRNYAMAHYNLGILCDLFLQQPLCAIEHFESYQRLVPNDAEQINRWLTDIRRRAGIPAPVPKLTAD